MDFPFGQADVGVTNQCTLEGLSIFHYHNVFLLIPVSQNSVHILYELFLHDDRWLSMFEAWSLEAEVEEDIDFFFLVEQDQHVLSYNYKKTITSVVPSTIRSRADRL